MKILLMRHGDAVLNAGPDFDRELSEYGSGQVKCTISELLKRSDKPKAIYASPYIRAQQTASLVSQQLNLPVTTIETITPDGDPKRVINWLSGLQSESVLLVTHNPFVSNLLSLLVGSQAVGMSTGALASVEAEIPAVGLGELKSYFEPR